MVALKRQTRYINALCVCFAINNAECMAVYELILPLFRDSGAANFIQRLVEMHCDYQS